MQVLNDNYVYEGLMSLLYSRSYMSNCEANLVMRRKQVLWSTKVTEQR